MEKFSPDHMAIDSIDIPNIYFQNSDKMKQLFHDCKMGSLEIQKISEEDVKRQDPSTGLSLIHYAAFFGKNEILASLIGKSSIEINIVTNSLNNALHLACMNNQVESAKILINRGIDINKANNNNQVPLHYAAEHFEMSELLINYDADMHIKDKNDLIPVVYSVFKDKASVLNAFLNKNPDFASWKEEKQFNSLLHYAADRNAKECAKILIDFGAKKFEKNKKGQTPFDIAVLSGYTQIASLLKMYEGDVSGSSTPEYTPPYYQSPSVAGGVLDEIIVHLDLKGAPTKHTFFEIFFQLIKEMGATGVIIEWEDMLPFSGNFLVCRNPNYYNEEQVQFIISQAKLNNLKVIPLIQTFGHLEYLLKQQKFHNIREEENNFMDICPCHPDSIEIILQIIDQVLSFHKKPQFLHIGGDEVWSLGNCQECQLKKREAGEHQLFISHVVPLAKRLKQKYPDIRLLI